MNNIKSILYILHVHIIHHDVHGLSMTQQALFCHLGWDLGTEKIFYVPNFADHQAKFIGFFEKFSKKCPC